MRGLLRALTGRGPAKAPPRNPAELEAEARQWRSQPLARRLAELRLDDGSRLKRLISGTRKALARELAARAAERADPEAAAVPEASQALYATTVTEKLLDGVRVALPYTDRWENYSLDKRLLAAERYPLEGLALRRLLASGRFVDIGAHVGLAALAHGLLGDFRRIHAIEPVDNNFACLSANIARNGLADAVVAHQLAIGAEDGTTNMRIKGGSGRHFVLKEPKAEDPRPNQAVEQVTLDSFVARLGSEGGEVGYVKCDAQGSEGRIVAGAQAFLARRQAIWELTYAPYTVGRRSQVSGDGFLALVEPHFDGFLDAGASAPRILPIAGLRAALGRMTGVNLVLVLLPRLAG